ncbi:hypothetical protein [Anaeromassilibacillus senegalensis]|uniref:hypothetical protein n=1 Tax=Anaeromassilibacillus senegalensis TaxID=1673717 RepID=UPI0006809E4B|nr:hypothetical protein [Anaeromassilibacillus senegalensis]
MEAIALFLTLAVTVEGIVEYIKTIIDGERKAAVIQIGALAVAVALCILSGADIYAAIGASFTVPYVGCVLTGVFASRGANYASDILGRLKGAGGGKYAA